MVPFTLSAATLAGLVVIASPCVALTFLPTAPKPVDSSQLVNSGQSQQSSGSNLQDDYVTRRLSGSRGSAFSGSPSTDPAPYVFNFGPVSGSSQVYSAPYGAVFGAPLGAVPLQFTRNPVR